MPRFRLDLDNSASSSDEDDDSFVIISNEPSDDDSDYECDDNVGADFIHVARYNDPPERSTKSRSRYCLGKHTHSLPLEIYQRRHGYLYKIAASRPSPRRYNQYHLSPPQYPSLATYRDERIISTRQVLQYEQQQHHMETQQQTMVGRMDDDRDHDMAALTQCLARARLEAERDGASADVFPTTNMPLAVPPDPSQMARDMQAEQRQMQEEHAATHRIIQSILESEKQRLQEQAARLLAQHDEADRLERQERTEQRQREQQAQQEHERRLVDEQKQGERKAAQQAALAKEQEYLLKAKKLVAQLVQVQASVAPFESNKQAAKRRLQMKKIVNGKVNTLAEHAGKIREVAHDVIAAIDAARTEDETLKAHMAHDATLAAAPELARGKRYLINLLCSKVLVRVQADGFNGPRGDGFPLAHFLALVSAEAKELGPVLAAHLFTACPVGVPKLPSSSASLSEDEFMTKLGMKKDGSTGEFESFEKFLSRTEGIISIMADIMASQPDEHTLLSGHEGAILWLERFLHLLPDAPSAPLPLLTAPVLESFLKGAGHMLAYKHGDAFRKQLKAISEDIVHRLDESPLGKPSSIRLRKAIDGGFDSFLSNLPHKALPELYNGGSQQRSTASSAGAQSTFGVQSNSNATSMSYPFGSSSSTQPSPFRAQQQTIPPISQSSKTSPFESPFGGPSATTASNSFGMDASEELAGEAQPGNAMPTPTANPFGTSSTSFGIAPAPSIFGSTGENSFKASPFGAPAPTPAPFGGHPLPFGQASSTSFPSQPSANSSSVPFGSSAGPFESSSAAPANNSTFGATSSFGGPTSAPPPFGSGSKATPFGSSAPGPSPFGASPNNTGMRSSVSAPFGASTAFGSSNAAPAPFGTSAPAPAPAWLSSTTATPFGNATAPSPFGGGSSAPAPFGSSSSTPLGGSAAKSSPFSSFGAAPAANSNPSPFSVPAPNNNPSPFSAPVPASNPLPFGAPAPTSNPSPFGAPAPGYSNPTPFGAPTPFGTPANNPTSLGAVPAPGNNGSSDDRPICKFYAQGRCHFGQNCRFRHEGPTTGSAGGGSGFSSNAPFGGPRR